MNFFKKFGERYFVKAMSAMALGLFSSLIIGLILKQIARVSFLSFLLPFAEIAQKPETVGAAIGTAVAWGLGAKALSLFSCSAVGAIGYTFGGPVGAFISSIVGAEISSIIAGRTKLDILIIPLTAIISGGFVATFIGPHIQAFMHFLGNFINIATQMSPIPMGIIIAVVVGMALTAPISSAALCIMLNLKGLAAGAACVGCCAQMIGFGVMSIKDNGIGGLLSVSFGTSMLQFSNILKKPILWLPTIITSAILGPISTFVFKMQNIPAGAGMGTSGLVGQFGTLAAMSDTSMPILLFYILLLHFVAPAIITFLIYITLRKQSIIKDGDLKIEINK